MATPKPFNMFADDDAVWATTSTGTAPKTWTTTNPTAWVAGMTQNPNLGPRATSGGGGGGSTQQPNSPFDKNVWAQNVVNTLKGIQQQNPNGPFPNPGGGGATPTPTPSPNPNTGMKDLAGFASRYTPAMMSQIYENPWYILRDVFSGVTESSPLYQALRDMGGDPLTLYNLTMGSQGTDTSGAEGFVNWLANMYGQQGTTGGKAIDARALLNTLFSQGEFGADSKNTLGQILGAGDMSTQIRTMYNLARDASNMGMNPLAARGYQAALAQAGDRYGQEMLKNPTGSGPQNPTQWIAANMPSLAMR